MLKLQLVYKLSIALIMKASVNNNGSKLTCCSANLVKIKSYKIAALVPICRFFHVLNFPTLAHKK